MFKMSFICGPVKVWIGLPNWPATTIVRQYASMISMRQ